MHAVILCGGKGTRLRPFTYVLPKPLMPIGEIPILEIILGQLRDAGFTSVTLAVGQFTGIMQAFCGDGGKWGLQVRYCQEPEPLGTAGALTLIPDLPENFLVMNGDILCDLDFGGFFDTHLRSASEISIATYHRTVDIDFGVLEVSDQDLIEGYREKPRLHYTVSMGIYALAKTALEGVPRRERLDFPDLVLRLIHEKRKVKAHRFSGAWLDIGRKEDFELAQREFDREPERFIKRPRNA
jgi:NDP-mannose synthase